MLRQIGLNLSNQAEIEARAKEDLGFTVKQVAVDIPVILSRGLAQPKSLDILDADHFMLPVLWPTENFQPIDSRRIHRWDDVIDIYKAGKLLRTGLTEEQALSTVTNQSAQAVAIDDQVGSLEPGKDGDFVIWSGNPLSQFTRAEQTWIDGRRYFSLEEDAAQRLEIERERTQLIQAVLSVEGRNGR